MESEKLVEYSGEVSFGQFSGEARLLSRGYQLMSMVGDDGS